MLTLHDSMKLQFKQGQELIFIDRPTGFLNQKSSQGQQGLVEVYSEASGKKLLPVIHTNEIDPRMTGAIVFAENESRKLALAQMFKSGQIKQKFWFLTDRRSQEIKYSLAKPHEILLSRIKRSPFYELWEAETSIASALDLRKYLSELGFPILGDTENGGSQFFHLCLHSLELTIPGEPAFFAPPPRIFERLGVLRDRVLSQWLMSVDTRQRLFHFLSHREQTLRLSHSEDLELRWEALGPVLWGAWYKDQDPSALDLERFEFLAHMIGKEFRVRKMLNRGKDPLSRVDWTSDNCPALWVAQEGQMKFHFESERGLSHGLFLDQRNNRDYIYHHAKNLRVLNLFAYTCGFSLAAALGGAKEVVSVDVSREFLDWGKQNFSLNELAPENYEFFKQDSILFLKGTARRKRQFDIIVCDPPSFARNKEGLFSLEKNLEELLRLCWEVLSDDGLLIFSCNLEKWTQEELEKRIQKMKAFKIVKGPPAVLDYEKAHESRLLKSVFLKKL